MRPGPPLWAAMGTPRRPSRQQGRFPGLAAPRRGGGLTRKAERCWGRTILGTDGIYASGPSFRRFREPPRPAS